MIFKVKLEIGVGTIYYNCKTCTFQTYNILYLYTLQHSDIFTCILF